ncbi:O-antigen ligase family protein [Novosphingobium sp.]|uniref:O-antigen ligase family protein n=1 Tax=Novosphingobium sp. TaxID=1874826 RepID=UPI00333F75B1
MSAPERLIAWTIAATYGLWLIGGIYFAGPVLGWVLGWQALRAYYLAPVLLAEERPPGPPPPAIVAWLGGMTVMLVALLIGHANFGLDAGQTLKSAVGWAKGWALIALFPLAGYALPIRIEVLARAVCRLARQTLVLLPLFLLAPILHLPSRLWVSPLTVLGGAGDVFFTVTLYTIDPETGTARWQFFAPWAPAAGIVAVIHFLLARYEPVASWRWTAYVASVLLALLTSSRMALIALAVIIPLAMLIGRFHRPKTFFALAPVVMIGGWFAPQVLDLIASAQNAFNGARASSSRVRAALGRIAVQRWQHEAYWFGHGIVERGPHLVEYMPIGSHHTWYGLLYVKGLVGVIALAVPMAWTFVATAIAAMRGKIGELGLAMTLTYLFYSFGENLEVLTYLAWPALIAIGIALKPPAPSTDEPAAGINEPAPDDHAIAV